MFEISKNKMLLLIGLVLLAGFFLTAEKSQRPTNQDDDVEGPSAVQNDLDNQDLPKKVLLDAPFTPQAPLGNWEDIREDNGCEEATLLMAVYWARGLEITPKIAQREIRNISDFHLKTEGHFHDLSNADTFSLLKNYFNFEKGELVENIGLAEIKKALAENKVVIVPVKGNRLGNPNYQIPGPGNHKILIVGYDDASQEFITHDPGTSQGKNYRYKYETLIGSLEDYPTGYLETFETFSTSMITVSK